MQKSVIKSNRLAYYSLAILPLLMLFCWVIRGSTLPGVHYEPVFPFLWMIGTGMANLSPVAYTIAFIVAILAGYVCIVIVSFSVNRDIASPEAIIIGIWVGGIFFFGGSCFFSVPDMLTMVTASILLYLLLRSSNTERNMSYLFLSGMIIGMATGIKIVNLAFVLALCIPPFSFAPSLWGDDCFKAS